jgi:predicted nucleic acid-binding protein
MNGSPEKNQFVDTNILVYAYDRSAGHKHTIAAQLVEDCWENSTGSISIQVLQELFVTVTRKIAAPLEHQIARQMIADLAHWRVHIPGTNDMLEAIDMQRTYQLSFWDAMVLQSATKLGCMQLLSEDLSHRQTYGTVQVINPFIE